MGKIKFNFIYLLLLAVYPLNPIASFAADIVELNPLIPINAQLRQIRQECAFSEEPEECKKLENKFKAKVRQLRKVCRFEPQKEECGLFKQVKKKKKVQTDKCFLNPHTRECIAKTRKKAAALKRREALCKKKPNSSVCRQRPRRKKRQRTLSEFCKTKPKHQRCREFRKYFNEKAKTIEPRTNNF